MCSSSEGQKLYYTVWYHHTYRWPSRAQIERGNKYIEMHGQQNIKKASTRFEHHVLIIRRSKLYYTASGIITPVDGRPVHRLREDWCTGRPPTR